jgi:hypothetical protein
MRKLLAIISLAFLLTINMPGQPDHTGSTEQKPSHDEVTRLPAANRNTNTDAHSTKTNYLPPERYAAIKRAVAWIVDVVRQYHGQADWWLVGAAFLTLVILGWQTKVARDAAKAAMLNAQAVIDAERPWFVASIERTKPGFDFWRVRITNKGRTPGQMWDLFAERIFVDSPESLPLPPNFSSLTYSPDTKFFANGDSFTVRETSIEDGFLPKDFGNGGAKPNSTFCWSMGGSPIKTRSPEEGTMKSCTRRDGVICGRVRKTDLYLADPPSTTATATTPRARRQLRTLPERRRA